MKEQDFFIATWLKDHGRELDETEWTMINAILKFSNEEIIKIIMRHKVHT